MVTVRNGSAARAARVGLVALVLVTGVGVARWAVDRPDPARSSAIRLPLDAYVFSNSDTRTLQWAHETVIRGCMDRLGLEFPAGPEDSTRDPGSINDRRYGVTNAADAARFGYHAPYGQNSPADTGSDGVRGLAPGCVRLALRTLSEGTPRLPDAHLVQKLSSGSHQRSRDNQRVKAAFRQWSECMSAKSPHSRYTDPLQPANDPRFQGERPTRTEKATAVADVACKRTTGLITVWNTAETAYQEQQIARHRKELTLIRTANDIQLGHAAKVLAEAVPLER